MDNCPYCGHEFPRNNSSLAMSKPREFWINGTLGTALEAEDSIENGYTTHAIEHSAYRQLKNKLDVYEDKVYHLSRRVEELEYLLKMANDREEG